MRDRTIQRVRRLRPADAERMPEIFPAARRTALLEQIVRSPRASRRRRVAPRRRMLRAPRRIALGLTATGGVALAAMLLTLGGSAVSPPRAAAVAFHSAPDGDVVAIVRHPFAAQQQLDAAFAAHGFDISVKLLPVSPSLVGTVISISQEGEAIQPIGRGSCVTGGGACPIGIKVARRFAGRGDITLGRPARPGERYSSSTSAFAPGEPLHCSGLLGARVRDALRALRTRRLVVAEWRELVDDTGGNRRIATAPLDNYIWTADLVAAGQLDVWTRSTRWPGDAAHGAAFTAGC
jgi:hypothetical protein